MWRYIYRLYYLKGRSWHKIDAKPERAWEGYRGMTDKELRKLSRSELLELLLAQGRENAGLQARVSELEVQLESKRIEIGHAGSIAEAALQLNDVIGATQRAADQYMENTRRVCDEQRAKCEQDVQARYDECDRESRRSQEEIERLVSDAKANAQRMLTEAEEAADKRQREAEHQAERTIYDARRQADQILSEAEQSRREQERRMIADTNAECQRKLSEARAEAEGIVAEAQRHLDEVKPPKRHFWQRGDRG